MGKGKRGFASMNPDMQRAIAARGGISAHRKGLAHKFNTEEARAAGKLGGKAKRKRRSSI